MKGASKVGSRRKHLKVKGKASVVISTGTFVEKACRVVTALLF
jgi:hypothetical protein